MKQNEQSTKKHPKNQIKSEILRGGTKISYIKKDGHYFVINEKGVYVSIHLFIHDYFKYKPKYSFSNKFHEYTNHLNANQIYIDDVVDKIGIAKTIETFGQFAYWNKNNTTIPFVNKTLVFCFVLIFITPILSMLFSMLFPPHYFSPGIIYSIIWIVLLASLGICSAFLEKAITRRKMMDIFCKSLKYRSYR